MDDSRFDDIIKGKVGEYQDPSFDPSALATLHQQMAAQADWPFQVRYRTEIVTGAAATLVILVTLWSQWYFSGLRSQEMEQELTTLRAQNDKMDGAIQELNNLKSIPPDTVTIIRLREQDPDQYNGLMDRIAELESTLKEALLSKEERDIAIPSSENRFFAMAGIFEGQFNKYINSSFAFTEDSSNIVHQPVLTPQPRLSAKAIRKKENYSKGVGFRLGPTFELSKGFYSGGKAENSPDITVGVLGDFILSPSLSFETGGKHIKRFYAATGNDLAKLQLPGVDPAIGVLSKADIDSWAIEVPMNFKYRYPISMKTKWLAGIGYSALFYAKQVVEYDYEYDTNNNLFIKSAQDIKGLKFYSGTINMSFGLSQQLKNNKIVEAGIYYQHGLGKMGVEEVSTRFLGFRGVYWFPLR